VEEESMNFKGYSLKSALGALAIGAALLLGGSEMAYAQDHHQRHERQDLREHQLREHYLYGDSRAVREHQRRERFELERHQRFERRRYFDRRFDRGYGYGRGYGRGWGWGWRRRYGW
jgi:type II secretory pathway component PulJ